MSRDGYLGNENLRPRNMPLGYSDEIIEEWMKCRDDPVYFAERYVKIINLNDGFVTIKLFDYQKQIIDSFNNYSNSIVLTARQSGKTTTAVCIILHYILFQSKEEPKTVALLANKAEAAREILSRIQLAYEALPKWLQQGILSWNKGSIELENKCKVIAAATSGSAIRGKSVDVLYIDETAFVENWDEFFQSVYPTISSGKDSKILLTSTPNGLNHFYKIWEGANKPRDNEQWNGYNAIRVTWQEVPGRDEEWAQKTLASLDFDKQKFDQEFGGEFMGSSGTLIAGDKLKALVSRIPLKFDATQKLKVYADPEPNRLYALIADVARGKGLDYSAFSVIDVTKVPYRQVAVYRNNMINGIDYSDMIYRVAKHYNDAYCLIEINDNGQQIVDIIRHDYGYENIIYTENRGRGGKTVSGGFGPSVDAGVRTTKSVKLIGCSILKMLVENDKLIVNDFDTIEELSRFSQKGRSFEAEPGAHDDLVMGLVLFAWMTDQTYFKDLTDVDVIRLLREKSEEQLYDELAPMGIIYDGTNEEEIMTSTPEYARGEFDGFW